jgi:hypothetical protein
MAATQARGRWASTGAFSGKHSILTILSSVSSLLKPEEMAICLPALTGLDPLQLNSDPQLLALIEGVPLHIVLFSALTKTKLEKVRKRE